MSFASNIFNAAFKLSVGTLTRSQALIADGFHSLADSLTAIVTIVTLKISGKPSDKDHPYGHGKIEFLASGFFSILLLTLAVLIMSKAIYTLIEGNIKPPNFLAIGPAVVSILVNIGISRYGLCVGKEIRSPVITANAKENKADAFSSIASLIGIVGALAGFPYLDPAAAILVSLLIARMGIEILRESSAGLMDASIDKSEQAKIRKFITSVRGVEKIAYLKTRHIGQRIWVDVGIVVPSTISLNQGSKIAHAVRNLLMRKLLYLQDAVVYLVEENTNAKKKTTR